MHSSEDHLRDALGTLPMYQPTNLLWDRIEDQLLDEDISAVIPEMKQHEPANDLWTRLEVALDAEQVAASQAEETKVVSMWSLAATAMRWAVAASVVTLIGFFSWNSFTTQRDVSITYSETWQTMVERAASWREMDEVIDQAVIAMCEGSVLACNTPEFKGLNQALIFLKESKRVILQQMSQYDDNVDLEIMLTQIEIESSDITQQVMDLII